MNSRHGNRARLGVVLLAALGAMALLALPSVAAAKDRNSDHIPDRWEKRHHLSTHVNQAGRDQDRDHLDNRGEFKAGDNPRDKDSDNDGVMDGDENAGTITSFDAGTGKLTIALYGGDTVSGYVTDDTRIKCGHGCVHHGDEGEGDSGASASHRGNSGPGGGRSDDPPSGPPGQGDDENDDPPGHDGTPPGASEGPGNGAENGASCTTDALVVGAVVEEAELRVSHGKATFEEIALERQDEDDDSVDG